MSERVVELWVLAPDGAGKVLPLPPLEVSVGPGQRLLPPARRAVEARYGLDRPVLELFVPDGIEALERVPVLLVLEPGTGVPPGPVEAQSLDIGTLPPLLRGRAASWLEELVGRVATPALRAAWSRPGWHARTVAWLDEALEVRGMTRTGALEPQRAWGISSVLRAESSGGAVWLKAAAPGFHAEPAVTRWLATRFPDALPQVLATDDAAILLLMADMPGGTARDLGGEGSAPGAVHLLARIAGAAMDDLPGLRALGLPERPLARLASDLRAAWSRADPVVDLRLPPGRLAALVPWVDAEARNLGALRIPDTLVHGDFHAGNVGLDGAAPRIFDWSDAALANPLLDATPWMQDAETAAESEALWAPWVEAWQGSVPADALAGRRHAVLGLGAAYQLVSLDAILRGMEPELRHSLADSAQAYAAILDAAAQGLP